MWNVTIFTSDQSGGSLISIPCSSILRARKEVIRKEIIFYEWKDEGAQRTDESQLHSQPNKVLFIIDNNIKKVHIEIDSQDLSGSTVSFSDAGRVCDRIPYNSKIEMYKLALSLIDFNIDSYLKSTMA